MPIPDYQTIMLPLMKIAADGKEHRISEAVQQIATTFGLTADEREELIPSGKQTFISNRVHWAKTYLRQAGLLSQPRRAHFQITDRGRKALEETSKIDNEYLDRFPEFRDFLSRKGGHTRQSVPSSPSGEAEEPLARVEEPLRSTTATPDEIIRLTVQQIEAALGKELLDRILSSSPAFFEGVIVNLLLAMGYGGSRKEAGRIVGRSGDGGVDGVIDQDALGLERVYVQAKRYKADNLVGEPAIREFIGSLALARANKGVFVTTSSFTQPALSAAERNASRIVLIDGDQLVALMIRYNVGVRIDETLYLKKIDEDFFDDE